MQKYKFASVANLPDLKNCMAKPSHGHEPEKILLPRHGTRGTRNSPNNAQAKRANSASGTGDTLQTWAKIK